MHLTVHKIQGGHLIERREFEVQRRRVIKIGGGAACDVRLEDPAAARLHAVIEVVDSDVLARDLGTATGTLINGVRTDRGQLGAYNEIVIGDTVLQVAVEQAPRRRPTSDNSLVSLVAALTPPQLQRLASLIAEARGQQEARLAYAALDAGVAESNAAPPTVILDGAELEVEPGERVAPKKPRVWQAPIGSEGEKYDTRRIASQIRRDKRNTSLVTLAALGGLFGLLATPFVSGSEPRSDPTLLAVGVEEGHDEAAQALLNRTPEAEVRHQPAAAPPHPSSALVAPPPEPAMYTVRGGDTLGSIAAQQLGSAARWREIERANPGLDPSRIEVGQRLAIP